MPERDAGALLQELDIKEYEAAALEGLFKLGRTTAPNLVEATDIPQARIYTVLDSLADMGFVEVFPTRPKEYQSKPPGEVLAAAKENRRQAYKQYEQHVESLSEEFLETFEPLYHQASEDVRPAEELFHVVDVGTPSERETRALYQEADREIAVVTKSFEYFPDVAEAFEDALARGIDIRVLFLHPDHLTEANETVQSEMVDRLAEREGVQLRFSEKRLPWRGTLADSSLDYESGTAIFLVEEPDVPLQMRQAAVTENASLVAGMKRYVDLIWEYESVAGY